VRRGTIVLCHVSNISRTTKGYAMIDDRNRRAPDARKTAEAAFKAVTTKKPEGPPSTAPSLPGVKEMISFRIDKDVLEHFQKDGPGWQDRINAALRKVVGLV
jgi:uncharacterized protein (DUF4415 family)